MNRVHAGFVGKVSLALSLLGGTATAAEPAVTHLHPVAGEQGTTLAVTAAGKFDLWPPQVWTDAPGITFKPGEKQGSFNVEVAKDATPGPHLVRFFNASGASAPRFFIVSTQPELREVEPNDRFKAPQGPVTLPATVSGRLDKSGDVDSFAVALKRGQTLVAWLDAYVLGSTFDGMIRVVDGGGVQAAFNHDGRTLDPFLAWEASRDGTYIVQVMGFVHPATSNVQFAGGEGCVYRLHLTTGSFVRYTLPLAAQRGRKTLLQLIGWNLSSPTVEIDFAACGETPCVATAPLPGVSAERPLLITDLPEGMEDDSSAGPPRAHEVPVAITGRIRSAGAEARFPFNALKDRTYELKVIAARIGSPLDGWLKIEGPDGKELARNDDASSQDPQLSWTAPSAGTFVASVGDLTHRGGDDFFYRLTVEEARASVMASVSTHSFSVQAGKAVDIKVSLKRTHGFKERLHLAAMNLPANVSAAEVEVSENGSEATIKVTADAEAKPAGQPFQLALREIATNLEHPVVYSLASTSEDNGVPQGFADLVIGSTDQLWLTVSAADPAK